MDKLAEVLANIVETLLADGIALLDPTLDSAAAIKSGLTTFLIQIIATLVLLLFVRFKFWDKVTAMYEKRQILIAESIDTRNDALSQAEQVRSESNQYLEENKKNAERIISDAVIMAKEEADAIIKEAREKAEIEKAKAHEQIERERQEMYGDIKEEIVDVAYEIAKKVIDQQTDEANQRRAIDQVAKEIFNK